MLLWGLSKWGVHVCGMGLGSLGSSTWRFWEPVAVEDPKCPWTASLGCRAALPFVFLSLSTRWPAVGSALRRHCLTSLGLLLLLCAEVFTVARLSFVWYTFHRIFFLWQIISTQLILNFPLFAPAVELLA